MLFVLLFSFPILLPLLRTNVDIYVFISYFQCFGTNIVYSIFVFGNLHFLNHVIICKTSVVLTNSL
jgi:hypothetical protein